MTIESFFSYEGCVDREDEEGDRGGERCREQEEKDLAIQTTCCGYRYRVHKIATVESLSQAVSTIVTR